MPNRIAVLAAADVLGTMLTSRRFDVCAVRHAADLLVIPFPMDSEAYRIFHAMHCREWSAMTPELAQGLRDMVLDMFAVSVPKQLVLVA
jgi:hypothetical protein